MAEEHDLIYHLGSVEESLQRDMPSCQGGQQGS